MKRLPEEFEESIKVVEAQGALGDSIQQRHARVLLSTGLIIADVDWPTGFKLTDTGWEYLYRIDPLMYGGTEVYPPHYGAVMAEREKTGKINTREEFIDAWGPEKESKEEGWAEKIRLSPEPLENVDVEEMLRERD